jgi:hypothetical protein
LIVQIDGCLIDRLLFEEESHELDFKAEQYRFISATTEEKCEILKDLLAFANSWRRADAFILVGVKEVKGGRSIVVGISQDIDEAQLQQFVNSKTQRPMTFSYRVVPYRQERVGVFHIPVQGRPLFLKKDYGKLKKETVYLRRGTSTDIADPDEIAMMGSTAETQLVKLPRPLVTIDDYDTGTGEDEETGQEYLWEQVRIVNRGDAPAVSIVMPEIRLARKSACIRSHLRTIGPGEAIDADISGLRSTLEHVYRKMPTPPGERKILYVPLVLEYRGLDHSCWTTEHAVSFNGWKVEVEIVHESQQWTDLSFLEQ